MCLPLHALVIYTHHMMFVKCSRPDAGTVQTYRTCTYIYIHLYAFLNLFDRSVCCYHLAFVPKQNPRDTSTWKGPNSVWRLFGWSPKKLPVVEANLAIEKAFWPQTQLNPPQWQETFSVCITLEASTCSPGRCSQLCKQKRYNSSRAVTGRGQDQKHYTLGFDENPAPRQHFSWKSPGKKPKPKQHYFVDTWKVLLGVSFITKEKRRPPRIVRIVLNANKWACSGQQHSNTLSPRQTSKFQQHMSHKGPNRSSKEPNTSSNLLLKQSERTTTGVHHGDHKQSAFRSPFCSLHSTWKTESRHQSVCTPSTLNIRRKCMQCTPHNCCYPQPKRTYMN